MTNDNGTGDDANKQIEELTTEQSKLGKLIEGLITNYGKDPKIRKTLDYHNKRLKTLNDLWHNFAVNHEDLRKLQDENPNHMYFTTNYAEKVEEGASNFKLKLDSAIKELSAHSENASASKPGASTSTEGRFSFNENNQTETRQSDAEGTEDDRELQKLVNRQQATISILTHMIEDVGKETVLQSSQYYELKIGAITGYWEQIMETNQLIWAIAKPNTAPFKYTVSTYCAAELMAHEALIKLGQALEQYRQQQNSGVGQENTDNNVQMKLPKISLPVFDGNYLKWNQFYDLYTQMIYNQRMSNAQKMFYLVSNLTGEAKSLVRHLSISNENYPVAWEILEKRFNNKRILVNASLQKLLSQPTLQSESTTGIKSMHDVTKECLLALKTMHINIDTWDPLILHLLLKKLDRRTHELYEQALVQPRELQSVQEFLEFLELRFQSLEVVGSKARPQPQFKSSKTSAALISSVKKCNLCHQDHNLYNCEKFLKLSPRERLAKTRALKLCINCLKDGHYASKCTSRSCTKCSKKHNSLLHIEIERQVTAPAISREGASEINTTAQLYTPGTSTNAFTSNNALTVQRHASHSNPTLTEVSYVFLATAVVVINDATGNPVECRAILDSGAQVNLITERLVRKLGLREVQSTMNINGIGNSQHKTCKRAQLAFSSRDGIFTTTMEAFVLENIAENQPSTPINIRNWPLPENIMLADPLFNVPKKIDLLIGAELYSTLMLNGKITLRHDIPTLFHTVLGWVFLGKVSNARPEKGVFCGINYTIEEIEKDIHKLWEIQENGMSEHTLTKGDKECEDFFQQTTYRDKTGRFVVRLPFKADPESLGNSKLTAERRFRAMEKRLEMNKEIKAQYTTFMDEYLKLGHMKKINLNDIQGPHYIIPHHYVIKPDSRTTKLRVVFDASSKTSKQISLNKILHSGPKLQEDLLAVFLRFRLPKYVFSGDIEKMYRQIQVNPSDQNYQLILWRANPTEDIGIYKLTTVTYGLTSAPYLAIKCLQTLADSEAHQYPLGARLIRTSFYVDDLMAGSNSLREAIEMKHQVQKLVASAGFNLRKWCANHDLLLSDVEPKNIQEERNFTNHDEEVKTLGITWLPSSDTIRIKTQWSDPTEITKRTILADLAHIFDPLGLINPAVVLGKLLMQELWKQNFKWDDPLPLEFQNTWIKYRNELKILDTIIIPRHVCPGSSIETAQLHAFADASERAFGAAVYIRSIDDTGKSTIRLLCSKSRVAPVKSLTIPRLELQAARLSTQLISQLKKYLKVTETQCHYWTDSEIVLHWINTDSSSFTPFVAHRVAYIQENSCVKNWRHVSGKFNPADIVSRGMWPTELLKADVWFNGPQFLTKRPAYWPAEFKPTMEVSTEKRQKKSILVITDSRPHFIFNIDHRNSIRFLQRTVALVLRFLNNLKVKSKYIGPLKVTELDNSLLLIISQLQRIHFEDDIKHIAKHGCVATSSKISNLAPFMDDQGILRVKGRLQASDLSYDAKHQIILPSDSIYTKLIITDIHTQNLHVGAQGLLAITRQRYWPVKGKNLIKSIVHNCLRCTLAKPKTLSQFMGNLPPRRVQPSRPFVNSGVDFAGPIWIHYKLRGKRPQKSYLAIFCCFATKAIHIEVASDLTTDSFIAALRRFWSRRGNCRHLHCDNATNFVGACNQLTQLHDLLRSQESKSRISAECSSRNIDFHFSPPRGPHFGGLWEAAVKSVKQVLTKTTMSASLTYEELTTLMCEIEAVLNSRPLTPLSNEPEDLDALTPAHFLIGEPLTSMIDAKAEPVKISMLTRWKLVSHAKHEFWRRWSLEYLCQLQQRYKWTKVSQNIAPGLMVLIKEDNRPPSVWIKGRVINVIKGDDNLVRVADVKTSSGILRRPIQKLCPLPIENLGDPIESKPIENTIKSNVTTKRPRGKSSVKIHPINPRWLEPSTSISNKPLLEDQNSQNDGQINRSKRLRSANALLHLVLVCMLVLPISSAPLPIAEQVEIQPFETNPGIYFDNIGRAHTVASHWNVVVYFDMSIYLKEISELTRCVNKLRNLCNIMVQKDHCENTLTLLQMQLATIKNNNDALLTLNGDRSISRKPRAAINIIGNLANTLFGVLDQDYADRMTTVIEGIKNNENHLLHLIANQTSLIESTTNILKKSELEVMEQFQSINNSINKVISNLNNVTSKLQQSDHIQLFTSLAIQTMLLMADFRRLQEDVFDVITDAHHNKIHPYLFTPEQLQYELLNIQDKLTPTLHIPGQSSNLLQLYSLMEVKGRVTSTMIMFRISLPLTNKELFEIFRLLPVPTKINDTFYAILPSSSYMLVNLHRNQFYPMSEIEFTRCSILDDDFLCPLTHPLFTKESKISECEISLLNNQQHLESCTLVQYKPRATWVQLHNHHSWMYSVPKATTLNIVCESNIISKTLQHSGILRLGGNCEIKDNFIHIVSFQPFNLNLQASVIPQLNLSQIEVSLPREILDHPEIRKFNDSLHEIENLKREISNMKDSELSEVAFNTFPEHHIIINYTTCTIMVLFILVTIAIIVVYKTRVLSRAHAQPHNPVPEQEDVSFIFDPTISNAGEDVENQ